MEFKEVATHCALRRRPDSTGVVEGGLLKATLAGWGEWNDETRPRRSSWASGLQEDLPSVRRYDLVLPGGRIELLCNDDDGDVELTAMAKGMEA